MHANEQLKIVAINIVSLHRQEALNLTRGIVNIVLSLECFRRVYRVQIPVLTLIYFEVFMPVMTSHRRTCSDDISHIYFSESLLNGGYWVPTILS
jgi:hypothetical protein